MRLLKWIGAMTGLNLGDMQKAVDSLENVSGES